MPWALGRCLSHVDPHIGGLVVNRAILSAWKRARVSDIVSSSIYSPRRRLVNKHDEQTYLFDCRRVAAQPRRRSVGSTRGNATWRLSLRAWNAVSSDGYPCRTDEAPLGHDEKGDSGFNSRDKVVFEAPSPGHGGAHHGKPDAYPRPRSASVCAGPHDPCFPDVHVDNDPYAIHFGEGDWITVISKNAGTFSGDLSLPGGKVIHGTGKRFDVNGQPHLRRGQRPPSLPRRQGARVPRGNCGWKGPDGRACASRRSGSTWSSFQSEGKFPGPDSGN